MGTKDLPRWAAIHIAADPGYLRRPIVRAGLALGGPAGMAEVLGVSRQFAHALLTGGNVLMPQAARILEHATDGAVTAAELRPDVFGSIRTVLNAWKDRRAA